MANQKHLDILKQGVEAWNRWRQKHLGTRPDLYRADLRGTDLRGADLSIAHLIDADLSGANLSGANLNDADLRGADLTYADLSGANLTYADLSGANLTYADLSDADLTFGTIYIANLMRANLTRAALFGANLVRANLTEATLTDCRVFGLSAWEVELHDAKQNNLIITPYDEPIITVDNLKIAQFIYLLLNNEEIRDVIDTIAKKAVLILGRFTPERKAVLDALRNELRTQGYVPILFDFDKPSSRNFTETVRTLAHLSRFIIADLTDPSSIPQELYAIVPALAVPVLPLLEASKREYSMFSDLNRTYHWVLPTYRYIDLESLLTSLRECVIEPAELKAQELEKR